MSVTINDLHEIASSVGNATQLLEPAVKKLLAQLPKGAKKASFDMLVAEFPGLLAQFEDLGASVGMEMYDTMRAETHRLPAYKAVTVAKATPLAEAEQIGRACARFFLDPALSKKQATDKAMRAITDAVGLRTKNAMRQTVKNNAVRDPAKTSFARVPTGATTCAFCSMMASRGAVYATAKTAGAEDKYHHDCDCMIVPSWKGLKVNVKGYSDADHYANYHAARSSLEAEGIKYPKATQITERMRAMFPGEYTDGHTGKPKGRPKDTNKPKGQPKPKRWPKTEDSKLQKRKPKDSGKTSNYEHTGNVASIEEAVLNEFRDSKVKYLPVHGHDKQPQEHEIISRISGGDMTKGSCASLALAFAANSAGLDVCDYRGEPSRSMFADGIRIRKILTSTGVESYSERHFNDLKAVGKLLDRTETGKKYILATGRHAAVIRNTGSRYEYLELQSPYPDQNGWYELTKAELRKRFHCRMSHNVRGFRYEADSTIAEISTLARGDGYAELMGYLNTADTKQQKGSLGAIK